MDQELLVRIDEPDADDDRLEHLALGLREELLEVDVDDVRRLRAGEAPAGTRGLELAAIGALLVSVKVSTETVGAVVRTIRGWLTRGTPEGRSVTVTIGDRTLQLQSASPDQQERLIEEFLRNLPQSNDG